MPRLLGTEEWNSENLRGKIAYLLDAMSGVDELAQTFAPSDFRQTSDQPTVQTRQADLRDIRLEQFTEALGLLLASDRVIEARMLLADPGWVLSGYARGNRQSGFGYVDTNITQFVRLSLFAALAREGTMHGEGKSLFYSTSGGDLRLYWGEQPEREFIAVLPTLFSIALASKSDRYTLDLLADLVFRSLENNQAADLLERPEFRLFGIYERRPFDSVSVRERADASRVFSTFDGYLAFHELERKYLQRVYQMRNDTYHWTRLSTAGDLVDWVLLVTEVGSLRNGFNIPFSEESQVLPEIRFCRDLAAELA